MEKITVGTLTMLPVAGLKGHGGAPLTVCRKLNYIYCENRLI